MTNHRTVRTATAGLAAAALTAVAVAAPSTAEGAPAHDRPTSLAKVLAADGHHFDRNWGDFDILDAAVGAVLQADPDSAVGVLAKPRTKLTAFLPTDRAFRKLAFTLTGSRPMTEKATFRRLARAAGVDTIEQVLLYHVVPGKTLGAKRVVAADGTRLTTAQGGTVKVRVRGDVVRLADQDPDVANPKVIATNINKGNPQIAHAINGVLLPVDL
ncbi:fasciclin domain-containing protein [Nocardioides mangrovi]|uniref:Fasciclin domain-containing protein n=1 Tax=Nocardioides mangrovi TaxID=2874580 RepID=A0ABS7UAD2_9ACTN|nr:fasciclin domain-containing protein [Nocardioides mangrovi]MBZ5737949.1 fasciclin domain-containing protein [Nocardioides mangrovi]